MIGTIHQVQSRTAGQPLYERSEQIERRELIARALNEEHRDIDIEKVHGAIGARSTGWVQREGEEGESPNVRKR